MGARPTLVVLACLCLASCLPSPALWSGGEGDRFRPGSGRLLVTLVPRGDPFPLGERIGFKFVFENPSRKPLPLGQREVELEIETLSGTPCLATDYSRSVCDAGVFFEEGSDQGLSEEPLGGGEEDLLDDIAFGSNARPSCPELSLSDLTDGSALERGALDLTSHFVDLSEHFAFPGPGTYRIEYHPASLPGEAKSHVFEIRGGSPLVVDRLFARIRALRPEGWKLGKLRYGELDGLYLSSSHSPLYILLLGEETRASRLGRHVLFQAFRASYANVARRPFRFLKAFEGRHLYIIASTAAEERWPEYHADLKAGL